MNCDFDITIKVLNSALEDAVVLAQFKTVSTTTGMSGNQVVEYVNNVERIPTLAEETEQRQRIETHQCTNALVAATFGREVPTPFVPTECVYAVRCELIGHSSLLVTTPLDDLLAKTVEFTDEDEERWYNVALAAVGERLEWIERFQHDRCRHCARQDN